MTCSRTPSSPGRARLIAEARRAAADRAGHGRTRLHHARRWPAPAGADDLIANRMQFVDNVATGRWSRRSLEGAHKAKVMRDYCVREGWRSTGACLLRLDVRLPDAGGGGAPHGGQPRPAPALRRPGL